MVGKERKGKEVSEKQGFRKVVAKGKGVCIYLGALPTVSNKSRLNSTHVFLTIFFAWDDKVSTILEYHGGYLALL